MDGQTEVNRFNTLQRGFGFLSGPASERWLRSVARVLLPFSLYFLAAASTLDVFMNVWGKDVGRMFAETVELKRKRPWAYRVLVPLTLQAATAVTPESIKDRVLVEKPYDGPKKPKYTRVERARRQYEWGRGYDFEYFVMYTLLFTSLVLTQVIWWRLLRHGDHSPMVAAFTPPLAMLALPLSFSVCGYVYDFPELFLASLCLLLFVQRRWVPYYVTFALAVLNKESSVLWAVWCVTLLAEGRSLFLRHAAWHTLIGGVPFLLVRWWMADLPGLGVEIHIAENVQYWADPKSYFKFLDIYAAALPTPEPGNLLVVPFVLLLAFYGWSHKDRVMRTVFVSTVAVLTPLFVVFGFEHEIRVFTPAIPAFLMLAVDSTCRLFAPSPAPQRAEVPAAAHGMAAASMSQVASALRARQPGS